VGRGGGELEKTDSRPQHIREKHAGEGGLEVSWGESHRLLTQAGEGRQVGRGLPGWGLRLTAWSRPMDVRQGQPEEKIGKFFRDEAT